MGLSSHFATQLRKRRNANGWSQEEMGEQSGLTRNHIGNIERGEYSPTLETVEKIAKAFEIDPVQMMRAPCDED